MKCTKFMRGYLDAEKAEELSFFYRIHLKRCSSCTREVYYFEKVKGELGDSLFSPLDFTGIEEKIMEALPEEMSGAARENSFSSVYWLLGGGIILLSMVFVPFTAPVRALMLLLRQRYQISFHLVMGIVLTVYCAIFVTSHLTNGAGEDSVIHRFVKRFVK